MITVKRKQDDTNDALINRFRTAIADSGIINEMRNRNRHVGAAEQRKEAKKEKLRKIRLKERRNKR